MSNSLLIVLMVNIKETYAQYFPMLWLMLDNSTNTASAWPQRSQFGLYVHKLLPVLTIKLKSIKTNFHDAIAINGSLNLVPELFNASTSLLRSYL